MHSGAVGMPKHCSSENISLPNIFYNSVFKILPKINLTGLVEISITLTKNYSVNLVYIVYLKILYNNPLEDILQ